MASASKEHIPIEGNAKTSTEVFLQLYFGDEPLKVWRVPLDNGADVNHSHDIHGPVLVTAAGLGEENSVQLLLEYNADVNKPDNTGLVAVAYAAAKGHKEIVQLLINKGANVNIPDDSGATALSFAACEGHTATVQALLNHIEDVNKPDNDGTVAIAYAAAKGHKEIVQLLIKKGANVNISDDFGATVLSLAACEGHTATVQVLLDHVAHDSILEALLEAVKPGHELTVQALLQHNADWSAEYVVGDLQESDAKLQVQSKDIQITFTAQGKTEAAILHLLANCQSVTIPDVALGYAVSDRHGGVVEVLLRCSVNVNTSFALSLAAHLGHEDMVQLLLHYGTNVNNTYGNGDFALRRAAWEGHYGIVKLLLDSGAEVNRADVDGDTALMRAVSEGHEKIVELLLKSGADVQQKDMDGVTALFCAACTRREQIVKLLLHHGADATVFAHDISAIAVAAENGFKTIVNLFLAHYRTIYDSESLIKVATCRSEALVMASWAGHESIVEALLQEGEDTRCKILKLSSLWMLSLRPDDSFAGMFALPEYDELDRLVNTSVDITTLDVSLGYAILKGHRSMVEVLLKRSIALANQLGEEKIAELLLLAGA